MTTPIAIPNINSKYDDFNSIDMSFLRLHSLVFSTNRGSDGHDYDLYSSRLVWDWTEQNVSPTPVSAQEPVPYAPALMSSGNERGPNLVVHDNEYSLVFASDRDGGVGGLDLYESVCNETRYSHDLPCEHAAAVKPLANFNSPADDAYLSKPLPDGHMLFASNRDGAAMDIYMGAFDAVTVTGVAALSSSADDTAPYVYNDDEVVFVSDRAGGLGEHDIYCSRLVDGAWSTPVALTPFNSPRDEYRPIVVQVNKTQFMIFSSTRDGGQGGYDLYIVGYPGCPHRAHSDVLRRATPNADMLADDCLASDDHASPTLRSLLLGRRNRVRG